MDTPEDNSDDFNVTGSDFEFDEAWDEDDLSFDDESSEASEDGGDDLPKTPKKSSRLLFPVLIGSAAIGTVAAFIYPYFLSDKKPIPVVQIENGTNALNSSGYSADENAQPDQSAVQTLDVQIDDGDLSSLNIESSSLKPDINDAPEINEGETTQGEIVSDGILTPLPENIGDHVIDLPSLEDEVNNSEGEIADAQISSSPREGLEESFSAAVADENDQSVSDDKPDSKAELSANAEDDLGTQVNDVFEVREGLADTAVQNNDNSSNLTIDGLDEGELLEKTNEAPALSELDEGLAPSPITDDIADDKTLNVSDEEGAQDAHASHSHEKEQAETAEPLTSAELTAQTEKDVVPPAPVKKKTEAVRPKPVWIIKAAQPGKAVVRDKISGEVKSVEAGSRLRGIGRVKAVEKANGKWVIRCSGGTISQ